MTVLGMISGTSLVSEAFEKLVEAITSGAFEPGQKLSESELARQLGISRGPLREALGRLEGKLVTRTPRLGVSVVDFSRSAVEQCLYVREALEGMAARLAAENADRDQIDALERLVSRDETRREAVPGEPYFTGKEDEDFHFAIVRAARCEWLEQILLVDVYYQLRLHRVRNSTRPGRVKAALVEHRDILSALQAHDPDAAERAMRLHVRNARLSTLADMSASAAGKSVRRAG